MDSTCFILLLTLLFIFSFILDSDDCNSNLYWLELAATDNNSLRFQTLDTIMQTFVIQLLSLYIISK
jgi:hypothetical protein